MTGYPANQVFSPPELPPYLKSVNLLQPVVGAPNDEELIGILSVIRAAQKAAEIPGMGNCLLISRLSEHLFDVQMARYRSKHLVNTFPENTTYNPPTLPAHVFLQLEPVTGVPSEEEAIKVQDAIRIYSQFSSVPSMFDPRVNMELSQHLFDIQMARHTQRARQSHVNPPPEIPDANLTRSVETATNPIEEPTAGNTNNAGTGAGVTESVQSARDGIVCDAIERSNRLAEQANRISEQANLLIERSNQIAERSNQLVEQSSRPMGQSNKLSERFSQIFDRLNHHLEQSNLLTKESTKPVEKLGDVLGNINKVLVRIQHAIIRSHKGNTVKALDCLVNEKGETPAISTITGTYTFADFMMASESPLTVVIDGVSQESFIEDDHLGRFLRFYGIGNTLFKDASSTELSPYLEHRARASLSEYLSSCLG
ncbi:hypothetical protein RSAG8_12468, partial [Rhizoctonia solani AG-8 WAC10335]